MVRIDPGLTETACAANTRDVPAHRLLPVLEPAPKEVGNFEPTSVKNGSKFHGGNDSQFMSHHKSSCMQRFVGPGTRTQAGLQELRIIIISLGSLRPLVFIVDNHAHEMLLMLQQSHNRFIT